MKVFYIPNGPKNLASLFPTVDWNRMEQYYVKVTEACVGETIATGTYNNFDGECCEDIVRLHFLNYLGTIDAVNFKLIANEHESKSEQFQKDTKYPLVKEDHAISRFNVKANDLLTLSNISYREEDQKWLNELLDSPFVLAEWTGVQGQDDSYIPVTIEDGKMLNHKFEDRYEYEFLLQIKMSHQRFIIRN